MTDLTGYGLDPATGEYRPLESGEKFVDKDGGGVPAAPAAHAADHKDGGSDEVATATPAANEIVKATAAGKLADGWVAASNVTQHVAAIDHDALLNFLATQHRIINDAGSSTTELLSASKILEITGAISSGIAIKAGVDTSTKGVGDITLSGEQTLNGLLTSSSRVLVTDQTLGEENGIYDSAAGAWARASDADGSPSNEVANGNFTHVLNSGSSVFKRKYLLVTPDPIVVGTTVQTWEEHKDVDFGTTAGTATEGDDSRVPTQDENDALAGTDGTPGAANKFVTNSDPRNSDNRTDVDAIHDNVAGEIAAVTEKVTPVAADVVLIEDSAAGDVKKRVQLGSLPAGLPVADTTALVKGSGDATKLVRIEADGLSASTTRVITMPDKDIEIDDKGDSRPPRADSISSFPEVTTTSAAYVLAARFPFLGSTLMGTPVAIKIVGGFIGTGTGDFRIQDVTNALTVAEITGVSTTNPAILDMGTLSNIPAPQAVWEIQLLRATGTGGNVPAVSAAAILY